MSGVLIGQLILWLIIAVIVIAIVVYLVNWLYHRSSKEVSFVRTGLFGERVVINGGAFVLPFIHDYTPVNMNVLQMEIVREKADALITKDRMRVDIEAEFYVRVRPTKEAVSVAAATLGRRTMEPERLHALLSGKFVSALRSIASEMTMEEMHEQRGDYVTRVKQAAAEGLAQNGLELESVAITDLDQTDLEYFNPSNRFDAEGLTQLIQEIETRRKLRNDIEQESMILIRTRNLEAERQALDIERESETARLEPAARRRSAPRGAARRTRARAGGARHRGRAGPALLARGDREIAHLERALDQRSAHRLGARCAPARDRAHPHGRGSRDRGARAGREGADRQSADDQRGAHRLGTRGASEGDRTHPYGRGSRDRVARTHREGAHPSGARRDRGAHRQRGGDAAARHRTHPRRG